MIRIDAGMSTARFCRLIDMPERTWRRWQTKDRAGQQSKGPWPRPARTAALELARTHALAHPAWGHRSQSWVIEINCGRRAGSAALG